MRPLPGICLPGSTAHFQPLFTTLSGSFISRVYTTSRIILYRLAQTIMVFENMFGYNIWLTLFLPTEVF